MSECTISLLNNVFERMKEKIRYAHYYNARRMPREVTEDKEANCVDFAYFLYYILWCQYHIPCRFVYAKVRTKTRDDEHIWIQARCDEVEEWINLDPSTKRHRINDTYQILKHRGVYASLERFGKPAGCYYE